MSKHPEKPSHSQGMIMEVTEYHQDAISDHKDDIFFAAIESTRMPMLVTDPRQPDNPIVFANKAFMSMSGYSPEEVIGHNCRFLQGPNTDKHTIASIRDAIDSRNEITTEILNYRKDGSSFWNALFISPVYNKKKELVYYFASQLDVSRRRDAEEALSQAQKMEALGQLTGGISHDFNNFLQVMTGHVDIMKLKLGNHHADKESLLRGLDSIKTAVTKASALTQQLLAFARKQRLEGRIINLNNVAQGISDLVLKTLGPEISLQRDLEPDLYNCQLDPTQLEACLINVLINARDAMPTGGKVSVVTENVMVTSEDISAFAGLPPGKYVSISITDTGDGIPAEILSRVMDPFFTTKDEGKGTGLGLSMVYGFAKQSGGTATIYSEMGVGTTVRMYFKATDQIRNTDSNSVKSSADRGGKETVLVVDDRPEVSELAMEMLLTLGYEVIVSNSAIDAINTTKNLMEKNQPPQLLFSDIIMPGGMNGIMLARELRKHIPNLPILLTTGYAGSPDRDADQGIEFEVLFKPYKLSDLAKKVRTVIEGPTVLRKQ
ncbi:MAG: hybrid sensor histidine kinase/response regulator [Methylotenera sp.]|nr:MAG: hybrid sensor histidine kinase/response regulator [Methylotenera sp.]